MAAQKPRLTRAQALACVPVKSGRISEEDNNGLPRISYPQPTGPMVARLMSAFGRNPRTRFLKKLELDEMGAFVWRLIDGKRTVSAITRLFAEEHNLPQQEAELSVTAFLRELGRRGIIGLEQGKT